jgi:hypothetical protein
MFTIDTNQKANLTSSPLLVLCNNHVYLPLLLLINLQEDAKLEVCECPNFLIQNPKYARSFLQLRFQTII